MQTPVITAATQTIKKDNTDSGNQVAGDSDQYQNTYKSDNADTTVDGYRYSMSNEPMSSDQ